MSQIPETANKGLEGIVACTSEISTIHDTTLLFRGYTIEELAQHCGFEEVIYLLWSGKLPNKSQLEGIKKDLAGAMALPAAMIPIIENVAKTDAHSMAKLRTLVSYYGLLDNNAEDISLEGVKAKATQSVRSSRRCPAVSKARSQLRQLRAKRWLGIF
jgi:citrate synthase